MLLGDVLNLENINILLNMGGEKPYVILNFQGININSICDSGTYSTLLRAN